MINTLLNNILLGISLAAPIGPVSLEMIRRGLSNGFWSSFSVRLGGALGNFICLLGVYYGLNAVMHYAAVRLILWTLGAALLIYIGARSIYKGCRGHLLKMSREDGGKNGFFLGLGLALTSPIGILWWVGVFAAVLSEGETSLLVSSTLILGVLIWGAFLAALSSFGKRFMNDTRLKWVSIIAGAALVGYGVRFLVRAIQEVLNL